VPDIALPHYALGATAEELGRLIQLASHEEAFVADACGRAGIGDGARVVDAGCGPLGALAALSRIVGPAGTVIGVDANAAALEKARALVPHVRLVHADVHEVELDANADLVYTRLMLMHQADPLRTLTRMAALLRPGGVVIAHEPSELAAHAPASEPAVPAMTRVWELVIAAARARGARTDFGLRGRAYLTEAGFEVVSHRAYFVHYPPAIGYGIPRVALHSLQPTLIQYGITSLEEITRLDAELETAMQRDDVQWVSSPMMLEWIGRLPQSL
jgi:ubiquinone/menaquinone biosynthesis C-methylase UbiE